MRYLEKKNKHYWTLKKSVDKTKYEKHIVTGTEAGFMCLKFFVSFYGTDCLFCHNFVSAGSNNYRMYS